MRKFPLFSERPDFRWLLPVAVLAACGVRVLLPDATIVTEKRSVVPAARAIPPAEAEMSGQGGDLEALGAFAIPLSGMETISTIPQREWMNSSWQSDTDPAFKEFSRWVVDYLASTAPDREAMSDRGVNLAHDRRLRMAEMMDADPARALAAAIPQAVAEMLPETVSGLLERNVHGFGDLVTEYRCGDQPSQRWLATLDGKTYDARIYGSRKNLNYYLGSSLHGVTLDDKMAVLDGPISVKAAEGTGKATKFLVGNQEHEIEASEPLEKIETVLAAIEGADVKLKEALESKGLSATYSDFIYAMGDSGLSASSGYPKRRAVSHTHGGKRILILRLKANDDYWPANQTEAVFTNWSYASDGWDRRLRLTSYDKTWLDAVDITPELTLSRPASYYVYQNSDGSTNYNSGRWADDGEAAARAAGFNPDNYFCVVVATRAFPNGGIGWAAGKRIWVNGAFDNFAALMHHEFGHTLGLPHASAWSSTDGNPMSANRVNQEYGDENDPMGNGGKTFRNTYQAYFKNLSGWMPDAHVQTVTQNGVYTVFQDDGGISTERPMALKIARDHEIMYWLSIRGNLTSYVEGGSTRSQAEFMNGVSVVAVTPWQNPHTLDLNNPANDRRNSPLALNQSFYDSAADVTFRTVEVGGVNPNRYAKVQVTFGHLHRGDHRPLVSGGVYRFKNRHNNRYLTVENNSSANSALLQMGDLNTTNTSQSFVAWRNGNGSYSFNHQGTDKWLNVEGDSGNTGIRIRQTTRNTSGDSQNWNIFQTETDSLFILHRGTEGRLMEMDVNNQRVHQMNTTGTTWQQWIPEMIGISPGTYRLLPRLAESQGLEIGNAAIGDGPAAIRSKFTGYNNQQWTVQNLTEGRMRLIPGHAPTKALDVSSSATADGSRIQQWDWNQSSAQRWSFSGVSGHWLRFTPDCAPSSCMDARGTTSASTVQLWTYNGANSQQWRFADADPNIVETPFAQWTRRLQLSGNNALTGWDQDGDGVINLMEFALNGDPASAVSRGGYQLVESASGPTLMTAVRAGAVFAPSGSGSLVAVVDGLLYEVQASADLSAWNLPVQSLATLPPNEAADLSEGWEYRAFTASSEVGGNVFLRVRVSEGF